MGGGYMVKNNFQTRASPSNFMFIGDV